MNVLATSLINFCGPFITLQPGKCTQSGIYKTAPQFLLHDAQTAAYQAFLHLDLQSNQVNQTNSPSSHYLTTRTPTLVPPPFSTETADPNASHDERPTPFSNPASSPLLNRARLTLQQCPPHPPCPTALPLAVA